MPTTLLISPPTNFQTLLRPWTIRLFKVACVLKTWLYIALRFPLRSNWPYSDVRAQEHHQSLVGSVVVRGREAFHPLDSACGLWAVYCLLCSNWPPLMRPDGLSHQRAVDGGGGACDFLLEAIWRIFWFQDDVPTPFSCLVSDRRSGF